MRTLVTFLGVLFLVLVVISYLGPVFEYVQVDHEVDTARNRLHEAESRANQAGREHDLLGNQESKARFETATLLVRTRLEECVKALERKEAARQRIYAKLNKWVRVITE